MPVFVIQNLGCAKNQVDAEIMSEYLRNAGWTEYFGEKQPDVILVNTCAFIQEAKEEAVGELLDLARHYPDIPIIVCGCLSQRYGEILRNELPEVAGIFGNRDLARIVPFIEKTLNTYNDSSGPRVEIPDQPKEYTLPMRSRTFGFGGTVYVKVAEGCGNNCSYCAIPFIRGPVRSRDQAEIIGEIEYFLKNGKREIILIAQDLASYGADQRNGNSLPVLVENILQLETDFWLRLLYIHPDNFPLQLLNTASRDKRFLPYFDIPFQHASKSILRNMGRDGDKDAYLKLVNEIKTTLPESVIRSTFLTGFPGEKKKDFQLLTEFLAEAKLDWAGAFAYSPEEGTPAYSMHKGFNRVSCRQAERRKQMLLDIQREITHARLERFIGNSMDVILEEKIPEEELWIGRGYPQAPEVDGSVVLHQEMGKPGEMVNARVIKRNGIDLEAVKQ
jgi:ribosomal protein S12 methylthiotransferase